MTRVGGTRRGQGPTTSNNEGVGWANRNQMNGRLPESTEHDQTEREPEGRHSAQTYQNDQGTQHRDQEKTQLDQAEQHQEEQEIHNEHSTQEREESQRKHAKEGRRRRRKEYRKRKREKKAKNIKASIRIVCQNIRGRGLAGVANSKWMNVNQVVREGKIGILAIQEAHLTQELEDKMKAVFKRQLVVYSSQGENQNAQGVAFVLNKSLVSDEHIKTHEIIPGRAMSLTTQWITGATLTILNIYAPNRHQDSAKF